MRTPAGLRFEVMFRAITFKDVAAIVCVYLSLWGVVTARMIFRKLV